MAVTLTAPEDASTQSQPITFGWNAVSGATHYQIQVATDAGFATIVHDSTVETNSAEVSGLAADTAHHWQVRYRPVSGGVATLLGWNTDYSGQAAAGGVENTLYHVSHTALATGTLTKGYFRSRESYGESLVMVVASTDGTVLDTSNKIVSSTVGLKEFTFTGAQTITSGTVYRIGLAMGGGGEARWHTTTDEGDRITGYSMTITNIDTIPATLLNTTTWEIFPLEMYVTNE